MLVRLSGEAISKHWDVIKIAVKASSMPTADTNEDKMANVQRSLLEGKACCWVEGTEGNPRTLVITTLSIEDISKTKNLIIYCAHGFQLATSKDYVSMVKGLYKYALGCNCDNVLMYVWNDKLLKMLKKYGAETNYTLVVLPLR